MKDLIEAYLRHDKNLAENLKPNAAAGLESILKSTINPKEAYEERNGHIINKRTGLAQDVGELFRTKGRPLLKTLGQGRFIPRFADRRHELDKKKHEKETRETFEKFLQKHPARYIASDIVAKLTNHVAENFVVERNHDGSFSFARLLKGVKIDSISPEQIVQKISAYRDHTRTELESMRLKAKFRDEAVRLAGFTPEEARDSKKLALLSDTIKKLEVEYYAQPGQPATRAPSTHVDALKEDLVRQFKHENDYPVSGGTLKEMMLAKAYGDNEIELDKNVRAWEDFEKFAKERSPNFYETSYAEITGLDYEKTPQTFTVPKEDYS